MNSMQGIRTGKHEHPKLLHRNKLFSDGAYFSSVIPCVEFTIEFKSDKLIYQKEYTKLQKIIYPLTNHLHDR